MTGTAFAAPMAWINLEWIINMTTSDSVPPDDTVAAQLDGVPAAAAAVRDPDSGPAVVSGESPPFANDTATLLYSGPLRVLQFWGSPRST